MDYGLLALRAPKLFVEAKPLGENLDDRRWASQIMGYASVASESRFFSPLPIAIATFSSSSDNLSHWAVAE